MAEVLLEQFGNKTAIHDAKIRFVAEWLGGKNVAELERVATALYVTTEEKIDGARRASRIMELKPHVDATRSQEAIRELDAMRNALDATHLI